MEPVGRNQPCPCGSGRRYKECHGAIGAARPAATAPAAGQDLSWVPTVMRAALAAQKSGRSREAAEGYRKVLAVDPSNFDATHMLALVEYEDGKQENALSLLRHAIELRPEIGTARHNLRTLESMPRVEQEICRDVLPRLVARIEPVEDIKRFASCATRVHLVIADDVDATLQSAFERLRHAFDRTRLGLWAQPGVSFDTPDVHTIDANAHPEGGIIVLFGAARSSAAWLSEARPERVLLVVVRDDACSVIDRIDEISALGDPRPALLCATSALAERLHLPRGAVVPEPDSIAAVGT